jgi:shikimate 5-dehydrogenase
VRGQAAAARSALQRLRPEEARFYALGQSFLQQEGNVAERSSAAMSDTADDATAAAAADSIEQALALVRGYSTALLEQCAALDARAQRLAAAVAVAGAGGSAVAAAAARREAVRASVLRTESDTWELLVAVLSAREDDKAIAQQVAERPSAVLAENTTLKPSASDEEVRHEPSVYCDISNICMILRGACT